jgi:hypothetical protein
VQKQTVQQDSHYLKRERDVVGGFVFCVCVSLTHAIRITWLNAAAAIKAGGRTGAPSYPFAPNAYRIGVANLGKCLAWILPTGARGIVGPLIDFGSLSIALILLYLLTVEGLAASETMQQKRFAVVALFLAFLQFPLAWVVPYQRPETLPLAFYIAFSLWCLTKARNHWGWVLILVVAAYLVAFVRSDVPFIFGVTLMLLSFGKALERWGSRLENFVRGAVVAVVAGGVQLYLQLVRFPHLKYAPGVPVVMLRRNFGPHVISVFLIALLPFLGLALLMVLRPIRLKAVETFTVALCLLYLPVWFVLGIAAEVRIFVPFLFALCMVAARVVAEFVMTKREPDRRLAPQEG